MHVKIKPMVCTAKNTSMMRWHFWHQKCE